MAKERFRLQFKFWLDVNKPEEHALAEAIAELKENKAYSRVVRDGIRLMVDLWQGNLGVLLSLFPWIEEAFFERFQERQPAPDYALREQLARLERLLLEQGNMPISGLGTSVEDGNGGPKPLAVPTVPGPASDDDDDVGLFVRKAESDGTSAQNFLASAFGLQG